MFKSGIDNKRAASYDKRFSLEAIIKLKDVDPNEANAVRKDLTIQQIHDLCKANGMSAQTINSFNPQFTSTDLYNFNCNNVSSDDANKLKPRFNPQETIKLLHDLGIKSETVLAYHTNFNFDAIIRFNNENIKPEDANQTPRFNPQEIHDLLKVNGIKPEVLGAYDTNFTSTDIYNLNLAGIKPKDANKFVRRFTGKEVHDLCKLNGLSPDYVLEFNPKYNSTDIYEFNQKHIGPSEVNRLSRFSSREILDLITKNGMTSEGIAAYNTNFTSTDIYEFNRNHVTPDVANAYSGLSQGFVKIDGLKIISFIQNNVDPKDIKPVVEKLNKERAEEFIRSTLAR